MVTTWPKNFPVLGTGAEELARQITSMSGGRLRVKVYAARELVPAFGVFDAVSDGVAQMGHGAAYYWKGKNPAFQFFSTVPFGMNALESSSWLLEGGGLDLWREAYRPYGLIPMMAGNTSMQMAGWFNRKIETLGDFKGLKMRIPGLGGEVLRRLGGTPVNLPGGELLTAMQTGVIDATEWVNPYSDLAFGLHKVAKYYYYPGWHEPGTVLECMVNAEAFAKLPEDLQAIVKNAATAACLNMLSENAARNRGALHSLVHKYKVHVLRLPDPVLAQLGKVSLEVVGALAKESDFAKRVHDSYQKFQQSVLAWHEISERVYYEMEAWRVEKLP